MLNGILQFFGITPKFLAMAAGGLLLGIAVALAVWLAASILYRPAILDKPAYAIGGEAAAPAETPVETTPGVAEAPEAPPETQPEVQLEPEVAETPEAQPETQPEMPATGGLEALIAAGDLDAGKKISRKCTACHSFVKGGKNKVGPGLWDIVGQPVAAREGFKYSGALKGIGGDWTYETLDGFLTAPKVFAKGTKMTFSGLKKEADRANLIAWMRAQSDSPAPLP